MNAQRFNYQFWMLLLSIGGSPAFGVPENTNAMFVTYAQTQNSSPVTQIQLDAMHGAKESLQAIADPDGNWGQAVEGFQMSIRFNKKSFLTNEPIKVSILLRNTTNHIVGYGAFFGIGMDSPVCNFVITNSAHIKIPRKPNLDGIFVLDGGSRPFELHPQTQRKYEVFLDFRRFDLSKPGTYSIIAKGSVPRADGNGQAVIESGVVAITIEEKVPPSK